MAERIFSSVIVLIVIFAGLIYFKGKHTSVKSVTTDAGVSQRVTAPITSDADNPTKTLRSVEVSDSAKVSKERIAADIPKEIVAVEKAPVTFGYITHGKKIQIVGLMSRHDETGVLKGYLDRLSQKCNCSIEVDYRDNIMDAPWQSSLVDLFEVMQSGDFDNGALFIEAGHITLKGHLQKEEMKERVADILDQLHEGGLEIAPSALVKSLRHTKSLEQNSTAMQRVSENNIFLKSNESNLSSAKKETSPQPQHHRRKSGEVILFHKAKKKEQSHKTKVGKKRSMKKSVKRRKKYQQDIIAPSYMETTIDLERKVKSRKTVEDESEIVVFEEDKTPDDMIAKPKFTIMK